MTTILPSARSPLDVIGQQIGDIMAQQMPGQIQRGYERQLGLNALGQAEKDIAGAEGDPFKIAMAFAKAGAQNPALERSLGPLLQTALQSSRVKGAFPGQQGIGQPQGLGQPGGREQTQQPSKEQPQQPSFVAPNPFRIMTADEINAESERYAHSLNDPNAFQTRQAQLQNQNNIANEQRSALEDLGIKAGITPAELPRFMETGARFDPTNPTQWALKTKRAYDEVKSNDKKILQAFIPGLGSGLLGRNRAEALKRIEPNVQDMVSKGLEQETRQLLADNYVSPTEISELIHPLTPKHEKAIQSFPKGVFPMEKNISIPGVPHKVKETTPFVSYEEARERAPEEMKSMQNRLADFFLKNVDKNTSLLGLRDKLTREKDYDWRQMQPAIRQAMEMGLKLEPFQSTELVEFETQPPRQSLGDIFRDFDRVIDYYRGSK